MLTARSVTLLAVTIALAVGVLGSTTNYLGARYTPNKAHNLTIGTRQYGDSLVYQESIVKKSAWLRVVEVNKTFNVTNNYVITQVQALDQKSDGTGAIATRLGGGPGWSNITLRFKSQRSHGINFLLRIYAKPRYL